MEPPQSWLSEPDRFAHIAVSCAVFFVFIVVLTRLSGKRTSGNMNNFDWIITVGIGSLMASGILLRNVSMLDAMLAVSVLAGMQWLTTWLAMRSRRFAKWVKPQPRVLLHRGQMLDDQMVHERVTSDEVSAALRSAGLSRHDEAQCVVLETNGQFSIIPTAAGDLRHAGLVEGIAPDRFAATHISDDRRASREG